MELPEVWIRALDGVWHRATATYQSAAEAACVPRACGSLMAANRFQTGRPTLENCGELRSEICPQCARPTPDTEPEG